MKKKLWISLGAIVLTLGIGTAVYAADTNSSFQQMLPFMKQMHPKLSDQQLEKMHNACQQQSGNAGTMMKSGGMMKSGSGMMSSI